jgi:hypothetical protein
MVGRWDTTTPLGRSMTPCEGSDPAFAMITAM